ncbi:hypothetical protein [Peptacetobacter sp.]|uniref:hypothetical protein n=1 Tax=Peptacetobacter sp. TaxID=2991975 RepID=UPI002622BF76|nr:hypothetical protein [Peptacetobacter sp.]
MKKTIFVSISILITGLLFRNIIIFASECTVEATVFNDIVFCILLIPSAIASVLNYLFGNYDEKANDIIKIMGSIILGIIILIVGLFCSWGWLPINTTLTFAYSEYVYEIIRAIIYTAVVIPSTIFYFLYDKVEPKK